MPPIYPTSTYAQATPGGHQGYEYSRTHNPTRTALERSIASIENAKHGLAFASGMAAMDTVLKLFQPGDEIISTDDLEPGKRLAAHSNAITAAREAGIDHIVYTSLASPVPESPITFSKDHQDTETLIEQSGASYTILRNNLYTDMLLMSGPQAIGMGQLIAAAGDGRASYVTRADCARAAAAALMNATGREVLDITGPESIGQADIAALLSDIAGKDIPYVPMPAEDMVQAMIANGLPEFMARVFVSFDQAIAEGYLDVASDDLKTLTGKSGQSVTDFLTENRAVLLRAPQ